MEEVLAIMLSLLSIILVGDRIRLKRQLERLKRIRPRFMAYDFDTIP